MVSELKDTKELEAAVKGRFGAGFEGGLKFFVKKQKRGSKIFTYSGSLLPKLLFDRVGLHVGDLAGGEFAPTIEGAQLLGDRATKNVVEVSRQQAENYFKGEDLEAEGLSDGAVLLALEGRVIAAGAAEAGKIKNTVPKSRLTSAQSS